MSEFIKTGSKKSDVSILEQVFFLYFNIFISYSILLTNTL